MESNQSNSPDPSAVAADAVEAKKRRPFSSPEERREIIEHQIASGLSVVKYADLHGYSASTLFAWRRSLAVQKAESPKEGGAEPTFLEVRPRWKGSAGAPLELRLRSGHTIAIQNGFDEGALRRLIQVVDGAC